MPEQTCILCSLGSPFAMQRVSPKQGPTTHLSSPRDADIDTNPNPALPWDSSVSPTPLSWGFLPVFAKDEKGKRANQQELSPHFPPWRVFQSSDSCSRPARNDIFMMWLRANPVLIHSPSLSQRGALEQSTIDRAAQGFTQSLNSRRCRAQLYSGRLKTKGLS